MIQDHLQPGRNSLNLVRLIAAFAVIVSHSYPILAGDDALEPLDTWLAFNLGQQAVGVFFVISGLTLARSWELDSNGLRFLMKRGLRIFPALIGFGFVFSVLIGPFFTSAGVTDYFSDPATLLYPITVPLFFDNATPPLGVFSSAAMAGTVTVPFWTIEYELLAYLTFAVLSVWGTLNKVHQIVSLLIGLAILSLAGEAGLFNYVHSSAPHIVRFAACFLSGVLLYRLRDQIWRSPVFLPIAIAFGALINDQPGGIIAATAISVSVVVGVGFYTYGQITHWSQRTDISYGVYIYGWAVQQAVAAIWPDIAVIWHVLASLSLATLAGVVSWTLVERPAMRLKSSILRQKVMIAEGAAE
jgi:peptidoglycan/LPS O-acetylase OafA/YrhL